MWIKAIINIKSCRLNLEMLLLLIIAELNASLGLWATNSYWFIFHSVNVDLPDLLDTSCIKFAITANFLFSLEGHLLLTRMAVNEIYESLFTLVSIIEGLAIIHIDIAVGISVWFIKIDIQRDWIINSLK